MPQVLIQPTIKVIDEYTNFADANHLAFEIVDFAYPEKRDHADSIAEQYAARLGQDKFISAHGAFLDLYLNSPDHAVRQVAVERITYNLEVAARLNLKFVIFHTNCLPMMGSPRYYENWVKKHIEFWSDVVERYELTILLENMWDKTPEHMAQVIEGVASPRLRACFDVGHHNVFSRISLEDWFSRLGESIVYLHLSDNQGDRDSELALGEGNIDWQKLSQLVEFHCSAPYAVIENNGLPSIEKSLCYLQSNNVYPFSG